MVRSAVERFPQAHWTEPVAGNAFWQVAYHTLFYTHFYLHADADAHRTFPGHQHGTQSHGALTPRHDPTSTLPPLPQPYDRTHLLAFADHLLDTCEARVAALDLDAVESGFPWYPMSKLEHQLVNLRHLQHHTGQLLERLRMASGEGVDWVGSGRD